MKKKRQQYYYDWDIVNEGDLYEERLSITLFSCIELQYLCYDKGLSARHYDDQDESDDDDHHDHDSRGSVVEEKEEEEVVQEERQWDALISTDEEEEEWDGVPRLELYNIFCKSELKERLIVEKTKLKDRLQSIPIWIAMSLSMEENLSMEERQWDGVQRVRMKEEEERPWDALPSTALLNIICNSELKDRLESIPLVCKSWKTVTDDPRCWSSMIPDSISPEEAFIKRYYEFPFYNSISFFKEEEDLDEVDEEEEQEQEVPAGLSRLRTIIKKSGGGAAITSLYLSPFWYWRDSREAIRLITNCCPNLKHISFHGYPQLSMEALLRLFKRCKKLELMDLSYFTSGYDVHDLSDIQQLLCCLPNLRGLRIFACKPYNIAVVIARHLPQLSLLSYGSDFLASEDLSTILCNCLELRYLYVNGSEDMLDYGRDILDQASAQIPEFYYESRYESPRTPPPSYHDNYSDWQMPMEDELNCFEDHEDPNETDYFFIDYYDDILKQRKEKKEYHYMFEF